MSTPLQRAIQFLLVVPSLGDTGVVEVELFDITSALEQIQCLMNLNAAKHKVEG